MTTSVLLRSTPESQGVSSQGILDFVTAVERDIRDLHSFMLLRHGQVIAEGWWQPYGAHLPHILFSLSKSFTSSGIGLLVDEGLISVEDQVTSFFPDKLPAEVSPNMAAMRVKHLLSMATGHTEDATGGTVSAKDGDWVRSFLSLPVQKEPGSLFVYNSAATYMLSAIVQKVTGETLLSYLTPRLFTPLGISGMTWETCPLGINVGGWGLSIKTEDIARFGQMLLRGGEWNGQRILSEAWVKEASSKQIENGTDPNSDWAQGYGYQFWRCRNHAFRGDGAFGQYCVVMPDQDAVLAITSGLGDMQAPLNLVWQHLLPAMTSAPLPASAVQAALAQKLGSLGIAAPAGAAASALEKEIHACAYAMRDVPSAAVEGQERPGGTPESTGIRQLRFDFAPQMVTVTVEVEDGTGTLVAGRGAWHESVSPFIEGRTQRVASCVVWEAADTLLLTIRAVETPFTYTWRVTFAGDAVQVQTGINVSFGPTEGPRLEGNKI